MIESYYIFNPIQFKEFGYHFFEGNNFYYRYQLSQKLFWKNIYIPFGPVCQTQKGFENFLNHLDNFKFTKITIDLPAIYNQKRIQEVVNKLKEHGYKKKPYIYQDEETIILLKEHFRLKSERMNKVRYGYKFSNIVIKNQLKNDEIDKIYKIYLIAIKRLGFPPKNKDMFKKLSENCLVSLAYSKETNELEGYTFGYILNSDKADFFDKEKIKILYVMFTGLTDYGRDKKLGHAMHYELFNYAFNNYDVDIIDFHGGSRTKNRSYVSFKQEFSNQFYSLPGSFTKITLI